MTFLSLYLPLHRLLQRSSAPTLLSSSASSKYFICSWVLCWGKAWLALISGLPLICCLCAVRIDCFITGEEEEEAEEQAAEEVEDRHMERRQTHE